MNCKAGSERTTGKQKNLNIGVGATPPTRNKASKMPLSVTVVQVKTESIVTLQQPENEGISIYLIAIMDELGIPLYALLVPKHWFL